MSIRVYLIDEHNAVAEALRRCLSEDPGIDVVGRGCSLAQSDEGLLATGAQLAVLNAKELGDGFPQTLAALHNRFPALGLIVFGGASSTRAAQQSLAAGCRGYLDATASLDDLVAAVKAVSQGRVVLSYQENQCERLCDAAISPPGLEEAPFSPDVGTLSERETEVLACIAQGMTNQETADKLFLSVKTIETYRARMGRKLGVRGRSDFFHIARQ
ncbi:MAG: response regulator transcription factor, partial [Planctomycetales bacterium]|nr:response regulator transcription factor [Planctomycetales bacterium]